MRKALTLVVLLLAASLVAAPVSAKKPPDGGGGKPTTTTEAPTAADLVDCEFRVVDGYTIETGNVLHYEDRDNPGGPWIMWNGDEALFCEIYVAVLPATYVLAIEPVPGGGNRAFTGPYILFKEEHPGSDFCYREDYSGKYSGSVVFGPVTLPAPDANGDQCETTGSPDLDGPNVFTFTPHVIKTQGGPIWAPGPVLPSNGKRPVANRDRRVSMKVEAAKRSPRRTPRELVRTMTLNPIDTDLALAIAANTRRELADRSQRERMLERAGLPPEHRSPRRALGHSLIRLGYALMAPRDRIPPQTRDRIPPQTLNPVHF
jgi:hypothetical protein